MAWSFIKSLGESMTKHVVDAVDPGKPVDLQAVHESEIVGSSEFRCAYEKLSCSEAVSAFE